MKQTGALNRVTYVNGIDPAVYMNYTSQTYVCFTFRFICSKHTFFPAHVTGVTVADQPTQVPSLGVSDCTAGSRPLMLTLDNVDLLMRGSWMFSFLFMVLLMSFFKSSLLCLGSRHLQMFCYGAPMDGVAVFYRPSP